MRNVTIVVPVLMNSCHVSRLTQLRTRMRLWDASTAVIPSRGTPRQSDPLTSVPSSHELSHEILKHGLIGESVDIRK
jgi:hypothetical protein